MPTVLEVVSNALMELGALAQGETAEAGDADFALSKMNRIFDQWSARRLFVYTVRFDEYTLVPNLQPHTIGPTGATFTVTQRPIRIESANIILDNVTPDVKTPLNIRDSDWWSNLTVPDIDTTLPTDLYYTPKWPNGEIYLWPVPITAFGIQLETWTVLGGFTGLADDFDLPPGYEEALTLTLAESLGPSFGIAPNVMLSNLAQKARVTIQSLNSKAARISSKDSGVPTGGQTSPYFNYRRGS